MAYSGNGTGTQADPYQVTTIEQLVECFNIYSNISSEGYIRVYCKLMNDLDFNDSPQYWDCPSNLFYANNRMIYSVNNSHIIYIDGNGYGIYNLYCYNKSEIFKAYASSYERYTNQIVIQNLILEAIAIHTSDYCTLFTSMNFHNTNNSGIRLINCDLRIKYYSYYANVANEFLLGKNTQFTNCILNIDIILNAQGYTDAYGSLLGGDYDISSNNNYRNSYNEWKIRVIMVSEPINNTNEFSLFYGTVHLFSSFFIELLAVKSNSWKIYTSLSSGSIMRIVNCYFVIKNIMTSSSYKATPVISANKNGVNFYDNTIADNIVDSSTGDGSLLALTTAQCKDAEYLEQHGFIIAR